MSKNKKQIFIFALVMGVIVASGMVIYTELGGGTIFMVASQMVLWIALIFGTYSDDT